MKYSGISALLLCSLLFAGCASYGNKSYSGAQAQTMQTVQNGVVTKVTPVSIDGSAGPVGVIAGGVAGGVLGSTMGRGTGNTLATLAGAAIGAAAGGLGESALTSKNGLQIEIRLDTGQVVAIVQNAEEPFYVGDKVQVITSANGTSRVQH